MTSTAPQWPSPPADTPHTRVLGAAPRYSPGRVSAIIAGVLLLLVGIVSLGAGGTLMWANLAARHDGYLTVAAADYRSSGYAMTSDRVALWGDGHLWYQASLIGDVRVTATATNPATPLFIGIAPADTAQTYLAGTHYSTLTHLSGGRDSVAEHPGTAPAVTPARSSIWTASVTGAGTQALTWPSQDGTWMLVVTNADGSAPVNAHLDVAVTAPSLAWISATLLLVAAFFLAVGILLIALPMSRIARERAARTPTGIG